jgi:hypothetical protein
MATETTENTVQSMTIEELKRIKAEAEQEVLQIIQTLEERVGKYVISATLTRDYLNLEKTRTSNVLLSIIV